METESAFFSGNSAVFVTSQAYAYMCQYLHFTSRDNLTVVKQLSSYSDHYLKWSTQLTGEPFAARCLSLTYADVC
jgi:hypothetical protein